MGAHSGGSVEAGALGGVGGWVGWGRFGEPVGAVGFGHEFAEGDVEELVDAAGLAQEQMVLGLVEQAHVGPRGQVQAAQQRAHDPVVEGEVAALVQAEQHPTAGGQWGNEKERIGYPKLGGVETASEGINAPRQNQRKDKPGRGDVERVAQ